MEKESKSTISQEDLDSLKASVRRLELSTARMQVLAGTKYSDMLRGFELGKLHKELCDVSSDLTSRIMSIESPENSD